MRHFVLDQQHPSTDQPRVRQQRRADLCLLALHRGVHGARRVWKRRYAKRLQVLQGLLLWIKKNTMNINYILSSRLVAPCCVTLAVLYS